MLGSKSGLGLALLLFILALLQPISDTTFTKTINISYFESMESDFSNLQVFSISDEGAEPLVYTILEYSPGEWALLEISIPYDSERLLFTHFLLDNYEPVTISGKEVKYYFEKINGAGYIRLKDSFIENITIHNISASSNIEIFKDIIVSNDELENLRAFSFNPKNIESAEISIIAKGYFLFKCKDWNYTTQSCQGEWEYQFPITPGKPYTIHLNSLDPGYAESGPFIAFDDRGLTVTSNVYSSDNVYANKKASISYWVNGTWNMDILGDLNSANFKCELKVDLAALGTLYHEWFNSSSSSWKTICTKSTTIQITDTTHSCDVSSDLNTSESSHTLRCRIAFLLLKDISIDYISLDSDFQCVNLSNPSTYQNRVVNMSGIYYINDNVILCTDNYSTTDDLIRINASSITLDCGGSTLDGDDAGSDYGIDTQQNNYLEIKNCIITDFRSGIYTDANYSNFTNNTVYSNIEGFSVVSSSNNSFTNNTAHNNLKCGFSLSSSLNNTLTNNTANSNQDGFHLQSSSIYNTLINNTAQENLGCDLVIAISTAGDCNNLIENNTGSGGRPILYANESVTWSNLEASEVILCNADYSVITNVTVKGSDALDNNYFLLYHSDNLSISDSSSVNNLYGFYASYCSHNNFTNNTANSNNNYGFYIRYGSNNAFTNNTANYNNYGFYIRSSPSNIFTNNTADSNDNYGIYLYSTSDNKLTNNTASMNGRCGFTLYSSSNYNTLASNTVSSNERSGFYFYSSSGNNISNSIIINNSQRGMHLYGNSDNNTFENITLHGNAQSSSYYEIYFDRSGVIYPEYNTFTDIKLYNSTRYIGFDDQTHTNQNNFTNLSICYNSTIGCINWDFLNLTYANLANATTIILDPEFISLNTSNTGAAQFNSSANITIYAEDCAHPIYKASNFPDSRDSILSSGSKVNPIYNTCSNNIAVFSTVNDFSGYTKGYVGCVNLSNPSTYQNKVVNMSGIYYINDNVTLCTDNYSTTDDLIRINASSITLDCNGSTLDGDDAGDDYGIDTQGNDYLEIKNCIITDFESAISATGTTYSNFTNNTAISNTDGFIASSFNFNILLNNTATSNTKHGFHISSSSNNIFTNNTAQHNGYGFGIYTTSEYNTFTNNIAYSNNAGGFYLRTSTYSIFTNNTASSNSNGFYFYSSSSNNISNSIIINNLNRGIYLYRNSDNNTFENITLHGNAQSSSYEIYFDRNLADYPEHNTFTDIKLYNSTRYIGFDDQTHTNQNNFTNLSICYNSTIGCINWDFLNLTYANLANATTIILDPEFISLNTSNAGAVQFNSSANITVEVVSCIKPAEFIIRRLTEFPQSKNIILTSGQDYDPTSISCPSSTSIKFNISSFSGFAPLKAGITDCYTIAHPGDYWIVDDIDASSVNEVSARACINISSSNVNLNLNGFSIANGSNISGIFANGSSSYQYTNITIRDGTVTNFTHNSTIGPAYIGGIIFTYIENSSLSNLSVSYASKQTPAKVSTYGIFFDGSSYNSILNLTVHNNEQNGIRIESYSNYNNFSDIISLSNIGTGIRISSSLNNRIDQSTIYSNSGRGIHLDSSNYTMVLDTLTYDNSYGISLTSTSNNTLTNITSHTNSNGGFYSSASSGNNITNILSYNNTQEGFFITTSHFNKLENITTYTNSRRGLVLFLSNYNTLENITTYNNPWYGIFISSASNNNLINITSYNNSQHSLYIYANSDNNIFTDLTFYEDGKSPSYYEVYFGRNGVIYPEYNTFTDIKLYNSTRYIGFDDQTHTNQNNFTNLSICYNSTIGCINWDFLNLTYANLANATTIILDPEFISLNTSNAGAVQFNSSANITIYAEDCAHPIYKASNFPDSRDLILSSGSKVNPIYNTCSNNIAVFSTVNDFSGYTKGYAGCVNLSNPSTYQNKVVNMSGIYYINNDVILCTDNYSTTDDLIRINASFITLDCNDSILDGDNAGGDEGINTQQNNYLEIKNCIITDFERGIYLFNSTYNRIDNNNISNCINAGILISKSSNNTNITNNFITNTGGDAIKIDNSIYNWVYNNTLSNSNGMGVNCLISPYTTIEQNTISISQINGICIENTSYINVINNNISDSGYLDIVVAYAHYNNITSNEIHSLNDPGVFGGIVITAQSENNTIENNVLSGDSTENGIALSNTNYPTEPQYLKDLGSANVHNNIINNTITNYKKGIYVFNSTFNTFISNKVSLNNDTGFYLNISHNNSIYDNYFADNNKSVFDNGNNSWNTTYNCTGPANIIGGSCRGGNFYSDYSGMDNGMSLEPGHNYSLDGIGDQPLNYTILGGSAVDNLPLSNNASLYYLHKCRATSFCDEGTLSLSPLTSELEVALCSNFVSFRMREPALENTTIYISNIYYHTWFRGYNNSNISVGWQKYYNWSNQTDAYFYPTDKLVSEYLGFHLLSHIQSANISYANPGEINGNFAIKWARYEYSPIIWSRYDRPSYIMLNLPSIAVLQNGDSDGDGLSNYEELMNGTNPVSNDTDSDGLSDYNETHWVTDPNNPDVDNDGLVDGSDPMPCDTRYNTTYNMSAENGIVEVTCNASNSGYIFQDLNVDNGDDFTIRNCRILFNSTDNSLGDPRGITVLNGGRLQIYNSTIETYNRTYSWLFEVNGTTTLEDSTLFEMVTIGLHDSSTSIVNNCTMATWSGDNIINGKDGGNDIITNNTFMYCSNEGTGYPHRIITLSDTYNITISNNNFLVSCGSIGGIQISDNSHDNKIINNVVQNTVCFLDGPHANSNLSDNTIAYNNVSTSLLGAVILWGDNTKSRIIGNRLSGRIEANFADDAVIENNTIYHDGTFNYRGVTLDQSDNATIVGNHIYDRDIAIMVTESTNMNIKNNRIHNNTQHGIYVWDIDNSSVTNNTIHNSSMAGIFLNASSNNIITNNNISLNEEDGISLINSSYNNITENTLFDNSDNGIILEEESEHNLIQNNAVNESTVANVIIVGSNYNNIISNNLSNAKVAEMIVIFSGWITISDNELVSSSSMFGGIILSGMSSYCTINNNNISGSLNGNGISLTEIRSPPASDYIPSSCMYNNITNNTITNYQKGIDVFNSTFNIFTSNNVSLNNDTGFYLNISHNNSIYNNYFADNNKSVFDNGNNSWNTTYNCTILGYTNIIGGNCTGGNYWSDYNGTDNTGDGIGDTELPWQGSSSIQNGGDWLPLVPVAGPSPFLVRFTPPTPSNGTTVMSPPITINVSISGAAALNEVNFSWDNTTHGMYNSSLILMYNFDNIPIIGDNNTYVKDISNSSYDGVLIGDAHYVTGRYGEAINFDGDGDYLAIKNLHFDTTGEIGNLTVCVWFKTKESGGGTFDNWAFVDFDRSEYFNFFIRPNGLLGFGTTSCGGCTHDFYGSTPANDDEWHFGCAVFDSLDTYDKKLYLDGKLDNKVDAYSTGITLGTGTTRYGFIGDGSEAAVFNGTRNELYYNGTIDEVRIWNMSLSADQIQQQYFSNLYKYDADKWQLYIDQEDSDGTYDYYACASDLSNDFNCTEIRTITIDMFPPVITIISPEAKTYIADMIDFNVSLNKPGDWCGYSLDGPEKYNEMVAFWKFEKTAKDFAGSNHGTAYGVTDTAGYSGFAYNFDGDDYISIPNSYDINLGVHDKRTISAWFKVNDKDLDAKQVIYEEGATVRGLNIYVYNGSLYVGGWNEPAAESNWDGTWMNTSSISSNTWHHVVVRLDGTPAVQIDALKGYLDGANFANGSGSQLWSHSGDISIGRNGDTKFHDGDDGSLGEYFNGTIDEVIIYNDALTDTQIENIYNSTLVSMDKYSNTYFNYTKNMSGKAPHIVVFYCNDTHGNMGKSNKRYFAVDTVPPAISLEAPPHNSYLDYSNNIYFNFTAYAQTGLTIDTCELWGTWAGGWHNNYTWKSPGVQDYSNYTILNLTDGTFEWNVWCNDSNGNKDWAPQNFTLTVDIITPLISITYPENKTYTYPITELNYTYTEANPDVCWYSTDGGITNSTPTSCGNSFTGLVSMEGSNTWTVYIKDLAGHENSSNVTFTKITPDFDVIIESPKPKSYSTISIDFNVSLGFPGPAMAGDTCRYTLDDWASNITMTKINNTFFTHTNSSMPENTYTAKFWCNDTNGSINDYEEVSFAIDITQPNVTLVSPAPNYTTSALYPINIIFECNATDNRELRNISLYITNSSNQSFSLNQTTAILGVSNSSSWTLELVSGNYTWNCIAYDTAGNSDWGDKNRTVTINAIPILVNFTPPTLPDGTTVISFPIPINVSILGAASLKEVNFSWDNTIYGMYNDDLILMYNFDNISIIGDNDTHIKDISNSNYDGAIRGNTHYVTGRYGKSASFDGSGDYIAIKDLYYNSVGAINNITICIWFKTSHYGGGTFDNWAFVDFDRSEYFNFFIRSNNGLLGFGTTNSSGSTNDLYGSTPANDDEWHFGCAVFDSSETLDKRLYLDANLENEVNAYPTGVKLGTGTTRYGFIGDGSEAAVFDGARNNFYYDGLIDEVRIWNMSLSADQIQQQYFSNLYKYDADKWQLYIDQEDSDGTYDYYACASDLFNNLNCTETRTITMDMFPPIITIISPEAKTYIADMIDFNVSLNKPGDWCGYSLDGPEKYNEMVAFWKFEKTAKDFAGSNHGTAYGVTDTAGYSGFAYNFDGDDYISIPNSYDINLGTHDKRTISAWFKVNDKDLDAKQVIYEEGGASRGLNIYVYNGSLYVGGWNEPAAESNWDGTWMNTSSISSNTWHHVVVRLDGTPAVQIDALKGYLDGANFANGSGSQLWSHSGDISIGRNGDTKFHDGDDNSLGEYFNGTIDEVIIYNNALTDTQIENIYNSTLVSMDKYSNTYFNHTKNMSGEAPYVIVFYCNDTHGNMGKSNKRYFAVDTVPPAISLEAPPHNSYLDYSNNIYFNFTAYSLTELDTCELWGTWAGGWHKNYTWVDSKSANYSNYTILNLTDGTFEWNVWCNETTGISDWAPQNFTLTVDIITPLISITYPENKTYTYPITELNYTYTEANPDVCWYSTDG
ncbi:right-handed parallel beta-helix repeat-containing protein, partial [Candidatus Micrarchaeota archaeon]|nr:right-handed parallel beta-helix repeat-containing protein [Candidatus Micrarchaeota archaeon]